MADGANGKGQRSLQEWAMGWKASDIPDQSGKVAIVTGGNGGLGQATVCHLAAHGAHVIMTARNLAKAEVARREIEATVPGASLEIRRLDLGSLASIAAFAGVVTAAHPRIDLLFNNAGIMAVPEGNTADGFEIQFGTNHLGHFALTMRLLPALLAAPAGRVVSTSSIARFTAGKYDLTNPHMRGCYKPWAAYGMSKRANLQFAIALNRRLAGRSVTAYAADPGFARTNLQATSAKAMNGWQQRFWVLAAPFVAQKAANGALPQLRAGTDPAAVGGTLYAPRWFSFGAPVVRKVGRSIDNPSQLAQLWELSERETGLTLAAALTR
jgi:NAD(P)-dependent dehydrogenase (short-subunit alcohol dehydrogenase family)